MLGSLGQVSGTSWSHRDPTIHRLHIVMQAVCSKKTIINKTNHSDFNLYGHLKISVSLIQWTALISLRLSLFSTKSLTIRQSNQPANQPTVNVLHLMFCGHLFVKLFVYFTNTEKGNGKLEWNCNCRTDIEIVVLST